MGSFGLTEPLSGSDTARGLNTQATRTGDTWVINGAKRWIGNATFADIVIIWARDTADDKVKGFIVRTDSPGFSATKIEDKQSLRIVQNADITLTNVEVAEEDRLQRINGFRDLAVVLRLTRAGVAWQAVGNSIGAYEAAVAYSKSRIQFGKPIGSFQLVQELLAQALGNITASIALCVQVSRLQDQGRQTDAQSALSKAYVTSRARETVSLCREALGGNGIVLEYGVAKPFADAEAIYTFEGTRQMNTLIVGKAITGFSAFV
jgi:glutaryl-CoA dehydrogenase